MTFGFHAVPSKREGTLNLFLSFSIIIFISKVAESAPTRNIRGALP